MPEPVPSVAAPSSRDELVREWRALHERGTAFWAAFATPEFFAPIGDAWSPAENLVHLDKSNRPVARALGLPKLLLALLFGVARRPSRSYAEVVAVYRDALDSGVQAGRFGPARRPPPADPEDARRRMMARRDRVARDLAGAVERWREPALDRYRLPHPALGKLTVREMLHFTLYHNLHHVTNVARRKGWLATAAV